MVEDQITTRLSAISLLSSLKAEIGDLNKVKRIVKELEMVNAVPDFTQHSEVMNGCSDFLVAVLGTVVKTCPRGRWHGFIAQKHGGRD